MTQGQSELWTNERKKRLTASVVGSILKMKATTRKGKKVESLLYSKFYGNRATMYGIEMEPEARNDYVKYQQNNGHPCLKTECVGLVVSMENPWLAASLDDRVYDPNVNSPLGLAEYKNPHSVRNTSLSQACQSSKTFCLQAEERDDKTVYSLKRRHDYYFQIQCQLYCDGREWCYFVLRTEKALHKGLQGTGVGGGNRYLNSMHFILMLYYQSWHAQDMARDAFENPNLTET